MCELPQGIRPRNVFNEKGTPDHVGQRLYENPNRTKKAKFMGKIEP